MNLPTKAALMLLINLIAVSAAPVADADPQNGVTKRCPLRYRSGEIEVALCIGSGHLGFYDDLEFLLCFLCIIRTVLLSPGRN
ncbi:hypothetical protein BST61_g230 [Cercospora zeina]